MLGKFCFIAAIIFVIVGCIGITKSSPVATPEEIHPFAHSKFYMNPTNQALEWAKNNAHHSQAALVKKIGEIPQAIWLAAWTQDVHGAVQDMMKTADESVPFFVCYNIPKRDQSGKYSKGGAGNPAEYRSWIDAAASGLYESDSNSTRRLGVILEPDAAPDIRSLPADDQSMRAELIRYAVLEWSKHSGVYVYIDAGNPAWHTPAEISDILIRSGIQYARGFSLNVSNSFSDTECQKYGDAICAIFKQRGYGNKFYVIDSGRSGKKVTGTVYNNPNRGLGEQPSGESGIKSPNQDARLWVKPVAERDDNGSIDPVIVENLYKNRVGSSWK